MRTFNCKCANTLFFGSTLCLNCQATIGFCPNCRTIGPITPAPNPVAPGSQCPVFSCVNCQTQIRRCENNERYRICNGYLSKVENDQQQLCGYCRLNIVVPDLSVPENVDLWAKLETAKRRVLYGAEELGFPVGEDNAALPLKFAFKSEAVEPVSTGHLDGCITISLGEVDDVKREKTRVEFGESQRTLVGHFRHELGHYYWELLVMRFKVRAFRETFGDETNPSYDTARKQHYSQGAPRDWQANFVSAYASMHPWEDFAETFGVYLDMAAVLSTSNHFGLSSCEIKEFDTMVRAYLHVGIAANELNRDMGLLDLVPEVFTPSVIAKLRFIHGLRRTKC